MGSNSESKVETNTVTDAYNTTSSIVNNLTDVGSIHVGDGMAANSSSFDKLILPVMAISFGLLAVISIKK